MHRDDRVLLCGYSSEPIGAALEGLQVASVLLTTVFNRLDETDWEQTLIYNWPVPEERNVTWVGRHTLHECRHHLVDVVSLLTDKQA
jgi:hypothetical protein